MSGFTRILIFLLAWNAAMWLVLGLLFAPVLPGGWWSIVAPAVLLLFPLAVLSRNLGRGGYPSALTRVLVFRPFWYGQLLLPLLAGAGLLGMLAGLPFGAAQAGGRSVAAAVGLVLMVAAVWGYAGSRRLVVRGLEASFIDLPPGLDGLRIVQLSDLHVGPHTSRRYLARIAEAVRRADPHLIVLTGDQVDDYPRDLEPLGNALGDLSAPLGVIAIAGNHDVYAGWAAVRGGMERLGWTVLVNAAVPLAWNGERFWVAGTGDPAGHGGGPGGGDRSVIPDVERTLSRIPQGSFTLTLAHNPALWPALVERGVQLTLSGHTHYGQFAIPQLSWSIASVFLEHAMGAHRHDRSILYINPGTNYWGIPFRIGAPPEVTVVTLRLGHDGSSTGAAEVRASESRPAA